MNKVASIRKQAFPLAVEWTWPSCTDFSYKTMLATGRSVLGTRQAGLGNLVIK
jgi:hypothetical protein